MNLRVIEGIEENIVRNSIPPNLSPTLLV